MRNGEGAGRTAQSPTFSGSIFTVYAQGVARFSAFKVLTAAPDFAQHCPSWLLPTARPRVRLCASLNSQEKVRAMNQPLASPTRRVSPNRWSPQFRLNSTWRSKNSESHHPTITTQQNCGFGANAIGTGVTFLSGCSTSGGWSERDF
jgi:hypothetical protein